MTQGEEGKILQCSILMNRSPLCTLTLGGRWIKKNRPLAPSIMTRDQFYNINFPSRAEKFGQRYNLGKIKKKV